MNLVKKLLILLCFVGNSVLADPNKTTTFELGGASNSPGIAGKGELIVEERIFQYDSKFAGKGSWNYTLGNTKIRYGLIENKLEARLYPQGLTINSEGAGFTNTSLGTKIRFLDESKYLPSTDFIADFEIPLGREGFRNPGFDHSYMLVLGKQWIPKWGSIVNLSLDFSTYNTATDDVDTAVSMPYVFNVNYTPKPELNLFSHIYGTLYFTDVFDNPLAVDMGASYAVTKDLVLIGWLAKGLNDAAPAMTIDFGFVYRF